MRNERGGSESEVGISYTEQVPSRTQEMKPGASRPGKMPRRTSRGRASRGWSHRSCGGFGGAEVRAQADPDWAGWALDSEKSRRSLPPQTRSRAALGALEAPRSGPGRIHGGSRTLKARPKPKENASRMQRAHRAGGRTRHERTCRLGRARLRRSQPFPLPPPSPGSLRVEGAIVPRCF